MSRTEAKTHLSRLLRRMAAGEEIVISPTTCWPTSSGEGPHRHAALAVAAQPERFAGAALAVVEHRENELLFSAESAWEIAVKYALGKLPLPLPSPGAIRPQPDGTRRDRRLTDRA